MSILRAIAIGLTGEFLASLLSTHFPKTCDRRKKYLTDLLGLIYQISSILFNILTSLPLDVSSFKG